MSQETHVNLHAQKAFRKDNEMIMSGFFGGVSSPHPLAIIHFNLRPFKNLFGIFLTRRCLINFFCSLLLCSDISLCLVHYSRWLRVATSRALRSVWRLMHERPPCSWSFTYLILTTVAFYHLHLKPRASIPPSLHLSKVYMQGGKKLPAA